MSEAIDRQELMDTFYFKNGPCCAGCDWWQSVNSLVGDCTKSAPVPASQRVEMIGIRNASLNFDAGHVMTKKEHRCGDFKDQFDWSTLSPWYLRRIGCPTHPTPGQAMKQPFEAKSGSE